MNVPTITSDVGAAREAFAQYRKAVRHRHSAEDAAIMHGYRELAKGRPLISIVEALRSGGVDAQNRPRLAFARADATYCWYESWGRPPRFRSFEHWRGPKAASKYLALPDGTFPRRTGGDIRALVPLIPPQFRPAGTLDGYHLLWEAEWEPAPPTDPMLLKHIGGMLYAVLAQWDLTPLERAVLAGRLSRAE